MNLTEKEKAILWRWPLTAFVLIGITYFINYICGGSFMDEVKKVDTLWWSISLPSFLSSILTSWWSNILFATLVYLMMLFLFIQFNEYKEKIFMGFLAVGMFCLYIPFGKNIILVIPVLLSFVLAFFSTLDSEKRIDFSADAQRFFALLVFSSSLSVCFFYPFGIVFLIFVLDIVSGFLGFVLAVIFDKCVPVVYYVPKSGRKFTGWIRRITWRITTWIFLRDVPDDE